MKNINNDLCAGFLLGVIAIETVLCKEGEPHIQDFFNRDQISKTQPSSGYQGKTIGGELLISNSQGKLPEIRFV